MPAADKQMQDATVVEKPQEKKSMFRMGGKKKNTPEPAAEPPIEEPKAEEKQTGGIFSFLPFHHSGTSAAAPAAEASVQEENVSKAETKPNTFFYFFGKPAPTATAEAPAADAQEGNAVERDSTAAPQKKHRFPLKLSRSKAEPTAAPAAADSEETAAPAAEPSFFGSLAKASASSVEYITSAFKPRSVDEAPAVEPEPEPVDEAADKDLSRSCLPNSKAPPPNAADASGEPAKGGVASAA